MECRFCGRWIGKRPNTPFPTRPGMGVGHYIGDYVRHLIAVHWDLLVKIHDAYENGEIDLAIPSDNRIAPRPDSAD